MNHPDTQQNTMIISVALDAIDIIKHMGRTDLAITLIERLNKILKGDEN
tara:strand:+ start:2915 stop:3061 length:147 start_codon:yes stop_codon:yes gene_type:complete